MNKLILVLIDGLNYQTNDCLGYLKALVKAGKANEYIVQTELPSLSRPLYELILTGVSPVDSGIVNNEVRRLSKEESVFSLAKKKGLKTGAAAYYWISELYNCGEFEPVEDMEVEDKEKNINYGRFYWKDEYPSCHLYAQGEILRKKYNLDFLLIHPMAVDDAGHKFGSNSKEYRDAARKENHQLSKYIPKWLEEGYQIIVTADHGMSIDGNHGGVSELETLVSMWLIGDKIKDKKISTKLDKDNKISQKILAPLCCKILGIEKSKKMEEIIYE